MFEDHSFFNGDYMHWIGKFHQKSGDFSNNLQMLNQQDIEITSLDPIEIRSKDIDPEDFENLGLLNRFFEYIQVYFGVTGCSSVISVKDTLYRLTRTADENQIYVKVEKIKKDSTDLPVILSI